jgi:hypothetical protein
VQVQVPALQVWPLPHAVQALPPTPHVGLLDVWQWPPLSQHPLGHEVASQTQAPLPLHRCPVAHAPQVAPLTPQVPVPSLA